MPKRDQRFHAITEERKPEFVARGYKGRHFFPHRAYYIPRPLPEQVKTARRLWGVTDVDALWCVMLFADAATLERFPADLFFDKDVMIHAEHMGKAGLVATAAMYIDGDRLYTDDHQSDLVQRIIYRREHKSQVEKRFGTWHHMLLNSILHFAVQRGLREIHVPNAQGVVKNYLDNDVNPELFERLYNSNIEQHFKARLAGDKWVISVEEHREKLVPLTPSTEEIETPDRWAAIIHDVDCIPSGGAEQICEQIQRVADIERRLGINATWCVPGNATTAVKKAIDTAGVEHAFRGFDDARYVFSPRLRRDRSPTMTQLTRLIRRVDSAIRRRLGREPRMLPTSTVLALEAVNRLRRMLGLPLGRDTLRLCRGIDYYARGYRRTSVDRDARLTDDWLRLYHFEWVIDDSASLASESPHYHQGLLTLPIAARLDDASRGLSQIEEALSRNGSNVFNLPLASAGSWMDRLDELDRVIRQHNTAVRSVQEVVNDFHFSRSV